MSCQAQQKLNWALQLLMHATDSELTRIHSSHQGSGPYERLLCFLSGTSNSEPIAFRTQAGSPIPLDFNGSEHENELGNAGSHPEGSPLPNIAAVDGSSSNSNDTHTSVTSGSIIDDEDDSTPCDSVTPQTVSGSVLNALDQSRSSTPLSELSSSASNDLASAGRSLKKTSSMSQVFDSVERRASKIRQVLVMNPNMFICDNFVEDPRIQFLMSSEDAKTGTHTVLRGLSQISIAGDYDEYQQRLDQAGHKRPDREEFFREQGVPKSRMAVKGLEHGKRLLKWRELLASSGAPSGILLLLFFAYSRLLSLNPTSHGVEALAQNPNIAELAPSTSAWFERAKKSFDERVSTWKQRNSKVKRSSDFHNITAKRRRPTANAADQQQRRNIQPTHQNEIQSDTLANDMNAVGKAPQQTVSGSVHTSAHQAAAPSNPMAYEWPAASQTDPANFVQFPNLCVFPEFDIISPDQQITLASGFNNLLEF